MKQLRDYKIDSISPEEEILKVLHRNWFDIASQFIALAGVMFLFIASVFIYPILSSDINLELYDTLYFFILNIAVLSVWIFGFLIWIDYYFDIWIITSEKIINIEQKGLFTRRVSSAKYEKIQDVTAEVTGLLQTIINYGDVRIQTAGENENIIFRKISCPYEIKTLILKMQKAKDRKRTQNFEKAIIEGLSDLK